MLLTTKLDKSTRRIRLIALGFALVYCIISGKLVYFGDASGIAPEHRGRLRYGRRGAAGYSRSQRRRARDRRQGDVGVRRAAPDHRQATRRSTSSRRSSPDLSIRELTEKLGSHKGFIWVKRAVTPAQQQAVYHLGLPGIGFMQENKRVYPNGPIAAHVLGYANIDGVGISGLEKYIDGQGLSAICKAPGST